MSLFDKENWSEEDLGRRSFNGRYQIVPEPGLSLPVPEGEPVWSLVDRTSGDILESGRTFAKCTWAAERHSGPAVAVISPDYFVHGDDGAYPWTLDRSLWAWSSAKTALNLALADEGTHRLVLLVGLPGSGKTTWLESHQEPGSVYFDATLTRETDRNKLVRMASAYSRPTFAVVLITPFNVCAERNASRNRGRIIAPDVMMRMKRQLLAAPPTSDADLAGVEVVRHE
jgi:hypothetical protein